MKSKKQLISIRLAPWMVQRIDRISQQNPLWTRSKVVSRLLSGVLSSRDVEELKDIVSLPHLLSKDYLRKNGESPVSV